MSAFIVSDKHISAIVNAYNDASDFGVRVDPLRMGQTLSHENYKSVNYRYRLDDKTPKFRYNADARVSVVQAIKLIHCLDYQSCEHDGWKHSKAKKFLNDALERLSMHIDGYDSAEWTI